MTPESVRDYYNRQYRFHDEQQIACPNALHDLEKARRRVASVLRGFGIGTCGRGVEVLDVGCGLGYYTKALSSMGATVTGLDFSETAIELARTTFPECQFRQGSWPDDVAKGPQFDLIWMVNFSLMNTFDVDFINERLLSEALHRLKPNGFLVIGWNSDFSGRTIGGYSHWPIRMLQRMRKPCHLSAPIVPEMRTRWLSWLMIRAAYMSRRSIPFFVVRQKGVDVS
jgi:SAM-dependent methyltransferase